MGGRLVILRRVGVRSVWNFGKSRCLRNSYRRNTFYDGHNGLTNWRCLRLLELLLADVDGTTISPIDLKVLICNRPAYNCCSDRLCWADNRVWYGCICWIFTPTQEPLVRASRCRNDRRHTRGDLCVRKSWQSWLIIGQQGCFPMSHNVLDRDGLPPRAGWRFCRCIFWLRFCWVHFLRW